MELRHLRYFVAVADLENVSRAALKLHVSQPALSRQIRDLEDELGFALLERSAKSVRLTDAGRTFLNESRAVLAHVEEAIRAARVVASGIQDELHVGYAPTLTARILPPTLRAFAEALPKVRVKLHDLSTEEILADLRRGKLHLAISVQPAAGGLRGLRFEELGREEMRLAVSPNHPFARRRVVTLLEVVREPLIAYSRADYPDYHEMLEKTFAPTRQRPRVAEEHDGVSSLISGLEAGGGVAVVPDSIRCIAGVRLKLIPLSPNPRSLIVGAILPKKELPSCSQVFLDALRSVSAVVAPLPAPQ